VATLTAIFDRMTAALDQPIAYVEHDFEFHRALAKAAHNPLFPLVLEPYVTLMREARQLGATARNAARRSVVYHKPVLDAIIRRDPDAARRTMREHFDYVAEIITEAEAERARTRPSP
jgi:DNA-binding FadR family transcriptional regulator